MKHDYLLLQIGNAYDTTDFVDMLNYTTINAKDLKLVLVKMRIIVMFSVMADGRKLMSVLL
jgi:hypothetical protein